MLVVDEEAAQRVREEAPQPEQKPPLVDEVAPGLADAPRRGEAARRETAEDVDEQVVGESRRRRWRGLHGTQPNPRMFCLFFFFLYK